jgi:hypothetical protein
LTTQTFPFLNGHVAQRGGHADLKTCGVGNAHLYVRVEPRLGKYGRDIDKRASPRQTALADKDQRQTSHSMVTRTLNKQLQEISHEALDRQRNLARLYEEYLG